MKRKPLIVSFCIVILLAVAAIVAFYPDPDFRAPFHQPRGDAFTGNNTPVVFTGVVLQRFRPSGFWAGITPVWQGVRYRVESVSVGNISQSEVIVAHVIVGGNALYRDDYPALSKRAFRVGARLRIHAQQLPDTGDLVCWEQESNVSVRRGASSRRAQRCERVDAYDIYDSASRNFQAGSTWTGARAGGAS